MFRSFILLFSCVLFSLNGNGQSRLINGQIADINTKTGIPYAHIYVQDQAHGTVSNENGYFEIKISSEINIPVLVISHVGYMSAVIKINELDSDQIFVLLESTENLLDEIVIRPYRDSVKQILISAGARIKKNYPTKPYMMKAFYREVNRQGDQHVRLVEAAVSIYDRGYDKNIIDANNLSVKVEEIRRSDDRIQLSWKEAIRKWVYERNGVHKTLRDDPLRRIAFANNNFQLIALEYEHLDVNKRITNPAIENFVFFKSLFFLDGKYTFLLDSISLYEDIPVYCISFFEQEPSSKKLAVGEGKIIIRQDNLAVLDFLGRLVRTNAEAPYKYFTPFENNLLSVYHIKYREVRGKYYLSYISSKSYGSNNPYFGGFTEDVNKRLFQFNELLVTDLDLKKARPFKKSEVMKQDKDLYDAKAKYNEEFWKEYTFMIDREIEDRIKNELEVKTPLTIQFKKNK